MWDEIQIGFPGFRMDVFRMLGLDATEFAGHSLGSGLAPSAAAAGAPERAIMKRTGHRSEKMVRRYIKDGSLLRENAVAVVGL